jgi:predicted RND superfamily exporter protein
MSSGLEVFSWLRDRGVTPDQSRFGLAFGFERIGLIPLRYPAASALVAILCCVVAAFGLTHIKVDDSLSQLFRNDTPEFRQYEEVTKRFPSAEYDVLIVVEGDVLERNSLQTLRNLVTDLQLVEGTRSIISLFSAREPAAGTEIPRPLFPEVMPEGAAFDQLIEQVKANEIIRGKLLSLDGSLALVVLALEPEVTGEVGLAGVMAEIRQVAQDDLAGTKISARLSGVPTMQLEIREAVERDRLIYNALGFLAGCGIAIFFFRRVAFMIIAAGPPLVAILLSLGTLGWLGFRLNMFLNVMTPLIMVISFADSMQLTFAARDRLIAGEPKQSAFRNAILVVGPACVLTHATAAVSFVALQFSNSDLIRSFGEAGLAATVIALLAVLLLQPLLGVLLIRDESQFAARVKGSDPAVNLLRLFCGWIAQRMVRRPGLYSLVSLVVVGGLTLIYVTLEPRYRLADQVPDRQQAVAASQSVDMKLAGVNPVDVLIEFPRGKGLFDPETLAVLAAVHSAVEKQKGVANVWSLETLRRWLAEKAGKSDVATLEKYVDILPADLTRRFISEERDAVVVTGRVPDFDASEILPLVHELEAALDTVRAEYPGYTIAVTGLSVVAARNSADMIGKLNAGLTIEVIFIAAFIGLAFRSVGVMFASILPALFPVVGAGLVLRLSGEGLQFASVVALIVSFGLGLSATIHFLNRLRLEERPGEPIAPVVERATILVGPAVILTSVVLACGLAVTVLSDLPSLRLFGWLSALAMLLAVTADLLILRPNIMFIRSLTKR